AHDRPHRHQRQLVPTGREDRPCIGIAKELVGNALHMDEVFRARTDTAENAKDRLNEKRRFDQASIEKMREIVEVADIVAFEFETRAAPLPQIFQDPLDILESVAEDKVPRHFQELWLPGMLPILVSADHR